MFGRSKKRADVLVVGAGPVGLLTALELVRDGIDAEVIDQAWRATGRSYAAALHPATLGLLEEMGLAHRVLKEACYVDRVTFFDGGDRRAHLDLSALSAQSPSVAVVPQSTLEAILEEELRARGRPVRWLHRLARLEQDAKRVLAEVEVLESVSGGYAIAQQGIEIGKTLEIECQLLVGADGCHSLVRRQLGIEYQGWDEPSVFDVFEFESDDDARDMRVVLDEHTANVLWTLPGGRQRWSFQTTNPGSSERDRMKSRLMMAVPGEASPRFTENLLSQLIEERAPWFRSKEIGDIAWAGDVAFQKCLSKELGRGRVWLAGDSVHQTSPIGVQSMNAGLLEARLLANIVRDVVRREVGLDSFRGYAERVVATWRRLLGKQEIFVARSATNAWVKARLDRLTPCLPATGKELALLASQLDLGIADES